MDYLQILLIFTVFHGYFADSFDCADKGTNDLDEESVAVSEVSPKGTVLAEFRRTSAPLQWTVYVNGSAEIEMTSFFLSVTIDNTTRALELSKPLDLELLQMQHVLTPDLLDMIEMVVTCETLDGQTKSKGFHVSISPENEFHPVFHKAPYTVTVPETAPVGSEIFSVNDKTVDMDFGTTILTFGISPYTISEFDGRRYVAMDDPLSGQIKLAQPLDFESFHQRGRNYFFINVTVSDDGGLTSVTSINVTVLDSDDQGVEFVYPDCPRPCLNPNYTVITNESYTGALTVHPTPVQARDLDTLNSPVKYALIAEEDLRYFRIEEASGQLFKTAPLLNDSYGYNILLQVMASERDDDGHFLVTNMSILIAERMPITDGTATYEFTSY